MELVILMTKDMVVIYSKQTLSISIVASGNHKEIENNDCVESHAVDGDGIQCGLQV